MLCALKYIFLHAAFQDLSNTKIKNRQYPLFGKRVSMIIITRKRITFILYRKNETFIFKLQYKLEPQTKVLNCYL